MTAVWVAARRVAGPPVVALLATWLAAAVLVLLGAGPRLVGSAPLTLTALALGGRLSYRGPLVDDVAGSTVFAVPTTLTLVCLAVLAAGVARAARRAPGSAALLPTGLLVLVAGAVVAAHVGAAATTSSAGSPLRYAADPWAAAVGAAVGGALAMAVGLAVAGRVRPGGLGRRWAADLSAAATATLPLLVAASAAALLLAGYAGGFSPGRLAVLLAGLPSLATAVVLVAFGVPLDVHASYAGLVEQVPYVAAEAVYDGGSRATVTLLQIVDRHALAMSLPVVAAGLLLAGGGRLALGAADRPAAVRRAVAFAVLLAAGAVVAALVTQISASAHGGGASLPVAASVGFAPAAAAGLGLLWGAAAAAAGLAGAARLTDDQAGALRRTLRLPARVVHTDT